MITKPYLSVIMPAYGEEKTIEQDIVALDETLSQTRFTYELIVVIDGKKDGTDQSYAKAKKHACNHIHIYTYEQNRGKGYAVRFGIAKSSGVVVSFIDSGMEISPNSLSLALEHFIWYRADIIVGSKRHPASHVKYPWKRRLLSFGYQILVWFLFGLKIRDTQVGMKIYKRQVLEEVLPRLIVKRYAFDIEILALAHALGYKRIFEAPVELTFNDHFTVNSSGLKTIFQMFWNTLAIYYRLVWRKYYSRKNRNNWLSDEDLSITPIAIKSSSIQDNMNTPYPNLFKAVDK